MMWCPQQRPSRSRSRRLHFTLSFRCSRSAHAAALMLQPLDIAALQQRPALHQLMQARLVCPRPGPLPLSVQNGAWRSLRRQPLQSWRSATCSLRRSRGWLPAASSRQRTAPPLQTQGRPHTEVVLPAPATTAAPRWTSSRLTAGRLICLSILCRLFSGTCCSNKSRTSSSSSSSRVLCSRTSRTGARHRDTRQMKISSWRSQPRGLRCDARAPAAATAQPPQTTRPARPIIPHAQAGRWAGRGRQPNTAAQHYGAGCMLRTTFLLRPLSTAAGLVRSQRDTCTVQIQTNTGAVAVA